MMLFLDLLPAWMYHLGPSGSATRTGSELCEDLAALVDAFHCSLVVNFDLQVGCRITDVAMRWQTDSWTLVPICGGAADVLAVDDAFRLQQLLLPLVN